MAELPRLNGVIRALEQGNPAFTSFVTADVDSALAFAGSRYDGIVFEMEHNPWDIRALRDSMQYLLNRGQIIQSASLAPAVTPIVRVAANGEEKNQWLAKQALDLGAYGIVWPHISTVDQAYNAVAACRYPRLTTAPLYQPAGIRGDGPASALRYWGVTQQQYYSRADVWPLNSEGEILVILMIEDTQGITNLADMLTKVPGIGVVLIGEGDLSQELGHPRQYEHPAVLEAAVGSYQDPEIGQALVAYLTVRIDPPPPSAELRRFVAERLPAPMIPARLVIVDEFPRRSGGQLDWAGLPDPCDPSSTGEASYVEPEGAIERTLADLLAGVLEIEKVGALSDFFDLGGHSLQATQAVSRIREVFRVGLTIPDFLGARTVRQLAQELRELGMSSGVDVDDVAELIAEISAMPPDEAARLLAG